MAGLISGYAYPPRPARAPGIDSRRRNPTMAAIEYRTLDVFEPVLAKEFNASASGQDTADRLQESDAVVQAREQ